MTSQGTSAGGPPPFDISVAHSARMYDYWLLRHEALRTEWG